MSFNTNFVFTDIGHGILLEHYYKKNNFIPLETNYKLKDVLDRHHKIDYCFVKDNKLVTFQERCRSQKYLDYDDVLFRFNNDINKCELTTILADYMLYAVMDGEPGFIITKPLKYIVIDLNILRKYIALNKIIVPGLINNTNGGIISCDVVKYHYGSFIQIKLEDLNRIGAIIETYKGVCR